MLIDSHSGELFAEPKSSSRRKLFGAILALAITTLVFIGYTYLRNKHAQQVAATATPQALPTEPKGPPQALILIDDAVLQGGKAVLGGTVRNISLQKLGPLVVELELKRRKDGGVDKKLVSLAPAQLEPQQEGRYSLDLKTQEYGSARITALTADGSAPLPYTTASGQKRPLERTASKTITVDKRPPAKGDEFLNSPDNPARIP